MSFNAGYLAHGRVIMTPGDMIPNEMLRIGCFGCAAEDC